MLLTPLLQSNRNASQVWTSCRPCQSIGLSCFQLTCVHFWAASDTSNCCRAHTYYNCTVYKNIYDVAEQKSIGYFCNALIKNSAVPELLYAIELVQQIPSQPISTPKTLIVASSCFSVNLRNVCHFYKDAFHLTCFITLTNVFLL